METEKLATVFPALRRSRDHGSGTDWRLTSPACGLLAGCLRIARCRTGSAGPPSSAWPRTVTVPVISYDVCAATAASNGKKKDQRIEAGSRLGWQRMQRAGPTRPIYSAIVEPFWPLLAWRTLARPHGYPPATRLQLGHSASGAHLEQLWGNSGAVLEHPGAERDGEGWRWRGMHRGGGAGWGIVEGGHRVSPGPARDAGWWPAGLWGTSGRPSLPQQPCTLQRATRNRGGAATARRYSAGPHPRGDPTGPRAPPPQSQCGQRASLQANADERGGATAAKYLPALLAPSRG